MEQDIAAQVVGLGGATDFSLWQLFLRADFVVKFVIILLIASSIFSWALIFDKLKSGEQISIEDFNLDKQLLDKINKFAPIKHILKNKSNNSHEIIELLEDISRDLMNYNLEFRIQELESRFSKDLSEATFNELKELKKKQNIN